MAKDTHGRWENIIWVKPFTELCEIKRTTYHWLFLENITGKQEISIARLRIGLTHIARPQLAKREKHPVFTSCGTPLTFEHILTECWSYENERRASSLPDQLLKSLNNITIHAMSILPWNFFTIQI